MATKYADILLVNGDIDLSSYSVQIVDTNQKSLKQRLDLRLAIWQGEWKYYHEYGTPWKSYLGLGIKQAQSTIDQEIKRQIRKEEDVINIYNFKSSLVGREYSCSFEVMTTEGTVEHALNLKDDFTYEIPSYSSGCDKIITYQYWSSAPYDVLDLDTLSTLPFVEYGSILDPIKETENLGISSLVLDSSLKDSVKYSYEEEAYQYTGQTIDSATIISTFSGTYVVPVENYQYTGQNLTSATILTYRTINSTYPVEAYQYTNQNIISASITTT